MLYIIFILKLGHPLYLCDFFQDENDWLREELEDTEKRLEEALARLAGLEEEKKQWLFMEEVSSKSQRM